MSTPEIPTAEQVAAHRSERWHQNGSALLTGEALRGFLAEFGLLLYAPHAVASNAPSLVEAVLGAANATPSLVESQSARDLLVQLVAEGAAVPLNLLGGSGATTDMPDFVASPAAFAYVFTLRGDKGWKQPPSTTGVVKVSPLALNTYTLLAEAGSRSAADLANELGKGLTESAVLRALNELWQQLRVLPVPQRDGAATLWEVTTARFLKQIKAGANAGQPSALSALVSLYLRQATLATEDDVESFLSPLAPRSRVRDVLHALTAARELETVAIDGKQHLHVSGELPAFGGVSTTPNEAVEGETGAGSSEAAAMERGEGSRIGKFTPRKVGTGFVGKGKPFAGGARGARPAGAGRPDRNDRERRPFAREGGAKPPLRKPGAPPAKRSFTKPWDEERGSRPAPRPAPEYTDIDLDAGSAAPGDRAERRPERTERPARPSAGGAGKRPFTPKTGFGDRPRAAGRPGVGDRSRPAFGDRPRPSFGDRPRPSRPRDGEGAADRPARRPSREEGGMRPPARRSADGDRPQARREFTERPPRRDFSDRPPRREFSERPARPAFGGDRPVRSGAGGDRPPRREFTERPPRRDFADRPARQETGDRPPRPAGDRPASRGGAFAREGSARPPFRKFDAPRGPRKPFTPREGAGAEGRPPRREFASGAGDRPRTPRPEARGPRSDARGPGDRPARSFTSRPTGGGSFAPKRGDGGGYKARPTGAPGKKAFGKPRPTGDRAAGPGAGPGAGPFDKFKGGNKPWGKRPPARQSEAARG